ncbi:oligosaccharide flippase family protein [Candidatus Falkowbacteria bacterium]|nr:oligosaccharide flippase family protein [Candidatus Falkowbacteria bacterium]
MISRIKQLFNRNFVRDLATLQVGNFVSTGLSFAASIVFARVLGPDDYGKYVIIFAFTALVGLFMQWGTEHATLTLLPEAWARKDKEEVKKIIIYFLKVSILVSLTVGVLAVVLAGVLAGWIYRDVGIGELARWILAGMAIRFMFLLLVNILQLIRKIKHLTIIENTGKLVYILLPVGLVLLGLGLNGVVVGYFISSLIFLVFGFWFYELLSRRMDLLPSYKEIIRGFRKVSIRKYFKFGFLIAVDKNLASLYTILPLTFLGMFVANAEVGYYKIAFSYIGLALMILTPVSRLLSVQLPKSKTYGIKQLKKDFLKSSFASFGMMLVVVIPMVVFSKYLVEIFYGEQYLPTIRIIYMLSPFVLVAGWGTSLGPIYRTLHKMKVTIITNLILIAAGAPFYYWLIQTYGLKGMAISV